MKAKRTIRITSFMLLAMLGASQQALSQDAKKAEAAAPYPKMAPIDQYLMDRDAEIALARSAAPASISRDATILVLGRKGYEKAVEGKNGFVCLVGRSWSGPFDWPEFWNPKIKAADCLNPQAARSLVPVFNLRARMTMKSKSSSDVCSNKAGRPPPALAKTISTRPCFVSTYALSDSISATFELSQRTISAPPPKSRFAASSAASSRPVTMTVAPSRRNNLAVARPMPALPPVMTATFPSNLPISVS